MTEAMNYFQSLFSFSNFSASLAFTKSELDLVNALIKDAKAQAIEAGREARLRETAQDLMLDAVNERNEKLVKDLASIALWHCERSLRKYRRAAARYDEAGRLQTKKSKVFMAESRKMANRAELARASVEFLNNFANKSR
jgi:hypothetical protein